MPKIVDKEKKMKTISDAALKVFVEFGFYGSKMADIAQAAGMGKGTLYEYFKNKADILQFAFNQYFHIFSEGVLQVMKNKTRPSEKLLSLIDFALQHAAEWEDHCAVYVDYFGAARTHKGEQFSLSAMYKQMKEILVSLIREGQAVGEIDEEFDAEVLAEILVSVFDGMILHRVFQGEGIERELLRKGTMSLIGKGLLKGPVQDE